LSEKTRHRASAEGFGDSPSVAKPTPSQERLRFYEFGPFRLDPAERMLLRGNEIVLLTPKAFDTLHLLVRNSGHLLEKDELIRAIWPDTFVEEGSLSNNIFQLRKALGDDQAFIETVPRRGYRFVGAVLQLPHPAPKQLEKPPAGLEVAPDDSNGIGNVRQGLSETATPPSQIGNSRGRYRSWLLGASVLVAMLAFLLWYMRRTLPGPRITGYTQLTFDGHGKNAAGTDGSRLYFSLDRVFGIRQMAVSGGVSEPVPIELPKPFLFPGGLSPDGSNMLVFSQESNQPVKVSIVREPEGSVRFLTEAVSATWSPDGKSVAYSTADGSINLIRSDGTGARRLAGLGGSGIDSLSWSPDGKTIRFCKDLKLWEMASDGSNPHELLHNWRPSYARCFGQWTPNGEFFIFVAGDRGQPGSNFMNALLALDERHVWFGKPSAEPVKLTSEPMRWGWPLPSKDGNRIFADGFIDRGELVRFNSKSRKFDPVLGGISAEFVDFSRDGKSAVYVSYPGGILWKANLDGSKPVQLSEPPIYPQQPRLSPDGSQIAFMTAPTDGPSKAYVVSSAGGSPRLLFAEDKGAQDDPNWSPDGRRIAFSRTPDIRLPQPDVHGNLPGIVYILDLATHQVSTLPGSEGFFSPRWSPDGRFIEAESDNGRSLKIFDLVTQRAWVLETGKQAKWHTWSRDGRFIYFQSVQDHPGVFRIPVQGGKPEMVVDLKDFLSTGIGGSYFTLDPTDAPLLLHFNGSDDLYALTLEEK
jgi:DNA-binding winged helix-turn-helix (wHTH) protein/Tol biopolymer transport system component